MEVMTAPGTALHADSQQPGLFACSVQCRAKMLEDGLVCDKCDKSNLRRCERCFYTCVGCPWPGRVLTAAVRSASSQPRSTRGWRCARPLLPGMRSSPCACSLPSLSASQPLPPAPQVRPRPLHLPNQGWLLRCGEAPLATLSRQLRQQLVSRCCSWLSALHRDSCCLSPCSSRMLQGKVADCHKAAPVTGRCAPWVVPVPAGVPAC